ncbi:MAG: FAD-dependent oxidoreductase [Deltaproteobacteria bacterium]|jgi:2,4-dienoyl-CoA reductase-like NADH-dependent reductase (Old Yellow Enzyme family)|nr:FAD-dependent oxidoreductase [Deltaproteobacteria bacterium]
MASSTCPTLLSPGRIGSLELRNRIVVTAMGVNFGEEDGQWSDRVLAYHEEQARGGAGLIISGACGVMHPIGQVQPWQVAISQDKHIPGLKRVVDAVHLHGARFAVQLHQGGLNAVDDTAAGRPQWCPSVPEMPEGDFVDGFLLPELETQVRIGRPTYKVLTKEDIETLVQSFAAGAGRAKTAGCDAVEVHGGHGYVPSSFLSPKTNKRTDEYGGSLENRARLLLEIVRAVRAEVGPGFPLIVKIDSREVGRDGGITIEHARQTAQWIEEAGADAITVSSYHDFSQGRLHSASNIPHDPNWNLPSAAEIKQVVGIPIIASGRVEPEHADVEIGKGRFDFLAMGRKLLADPHLPRKLSEGRAGEIRPCIYCYTCVSAIYTRESTSCAVNPECGIEHTRKAAPCPATRKRVAVVGGGPGGMEASRRLASDGHEVVLLEKGDRLGGTLRFASLAYAANEQLLDWLRGEVEAAEIDVRLETIATPELLASLAPDAVVVATGALRSLPEISGADLPHVLSGDDMRDMMLGASSEALKEKTSLLTRIATRAGAATGLTANLDFVRKATHAWMPLGKHVVIVGGELVGLELAEFLSERGRNVTVVDEVPRFGAGITLVRRLRLLADLREHGLGLYPGSKDIRIEPGRVRFTDEGGTAHSAPADHVIVAKGTTGDSSQAEAFRQAGLRVHEIGDGKGVGYIVGAMRDAMEVVDAINAG